MNMNQILKKKHFNLNISLLTLLLKAKDVKDITPFYHDFSLPYMTKQVYHYKLINDKEKR